MLYSHNGNVPSVAESAFLAPNATIIGDVEIGEDASIWFNVVIRGDVSPIAIGARTNIQDGSILHATYQKTKLVIGNDVTVGHRALLHGCTIADHCLIGMGAIILDGAKISSNSLIAAGTLVRQNDTVPSESLVAGVPGERKRSLNSDEVELIQRSAENYVEYKRSYLGDLFRQASDW